ncbi:DUF7344 domain-containing protein [Halobellus litoreus]|uniref:ArsR family transcriptional regulator n=1 Tax=Halobellus litoreus TaxID=755310 RepID=A0ABD6E4E8_9EURY|nr:ArsR family transcriptional regulator [Halobellus litoreus]
MGGSEKNAGKRDSAEAGEPSPRFAQDEFYRALASCHRRRLLYYLFDNNDCTIEELTSVLSGWEATTSGAMQTTTDRSKLRLGLVHSHLPQLAEIGLIDYDMDEGTVKLEPLHPQVELIIEQSIEAEQLVESE